MSILQQANVVARDRLDEGLGRRELPESNSEVVCIVERVKQIAVERVDILETWEGFDGGRKTLGESLGRVFDFSRIERSNSADLKARSYLRG